MNDLERNYYNPFVRVRDFGIENVVDFLAGSVGGNNVSAIGAAAESEQSGVAQASGASDFDPSFGNVVIDGKRVLKKQK